MNLLAQSQICNPAAGLFGGCNTGGTAGAPKLLAVLIATMWRTLMVVGGLAVLIFLIWGGVSYLTSGGDKARIESARDRIISALVGLAIIFASAAIAKFVEDQFGISLLNPQLPSNL